MLTLKCFQNMAKRELVGPSPSNAKKCCLKMAKLDGDETRPRGCKYPTPQCALAKMLAETTVRAQFRQIENASPTTDSFLTFSTNPFHAYTREILGCLLGFSPRGQDPGGGNELNRFSIKEQRRTDLKHFCNNKNIVWQ